MSGLCELSHSRSSGPGGQVCLQSPCSSQVRLTTNDAQNVNKGVLAAKSLRLVLTVYPSQHQGHSSTGPHQRFCVSTALLFDQASTSGRNTSKRHSIPQLTQTQPHYAHTSDSIVMQSDRFRSQEQNIEDVLTKLHAHVLSVASHGALIHLLCPKDR